MSNLASCFTVNSDAKLINKEIEKQLKEAKREARSQVKLLVLGTAESGKSTFLKQMRIIHGKGYTLDEKKSHISLIHQNISVSVKMLVSAMDKLGIDFDSEQNRLIGGRLTDLDREEESNLTPEIAKFIARIWEDEGIQKCYLRRNEFHLLDSASYYLNSLQRIVSSSYVPTLQDILRTRVPTSGIVEYVFDIDRFIFGIVDVGGQKSERRKWINCFECVTSIIFLAALSEYDQMIPSEEISLELRSNIRNLSVSEVSPQNNNHQKKSVYRANSEQFKLHEKKGFSKTMKNPVQRHCSTVAERPGQSALSKSLLRPAASQRRDYNEERSSPRNKSLHRNRVPKQVTEIPAINRLDESCALFKTIVQNQFFKNTSVILFLNKTDILEEKVKHSPLSAHFPSFEGPEKDAGAARDFILSRFIRCFENKHTKRTLYSHYTCATDTSNIRFVFAAVKDIILQSYLVNCNLV